MNWIPVTQDLPVESGKYVVKTQSKLQAIPLTFYHKLEVSFHRSKNDEPVWGCNNQIVTHWLNEKD
jgi:hypothetical protein